MKRNAFTLTELLVVIVVIVLLFTVAAPQVSKLMSAGKEDGALNAIKAAVATARSYSGAKPPFPTGDYKGCAIIATPARELRVVQHSWSALSSGNNRLVELSTPLAGYVDTDDPQTVWPEGVGLVGLTRNKVGPPALLAPPFAMRFDRYGRLIIRQTAAHAIYYNGDKLNNISTSAVRPNNYDPGPFDPESPSWASANYKTTDPGGYTFSIEQIETVAGVIAYSKSELAEAGLNINGDGISGNGGTINAAARDWLLQNGKVMFFNRYTGESIDPR